MHAARSSVLAALARRLSSHRHPACSSRPRPPHCPPYPCLTPRPLLHAPPPGFLPLEFATYTRWSWALQPAYYTAGPVKKAAHTIFRPIKAVAWGLFGQIFKLQTGTPGQRAPWGASGRRAGGQAPCRDAAGPREALALALALAPHAPARANAARGSFLPVHAGQLKPEHGLLAGIYDTIGMVNAPALRKAFKSGKLATRAARVESVSGNTLHLTDGTTLEVRPGAEHGWGGGLGGRLGWGAGAGGAQPARLPAHHCGCRPGCVLLQPSMPAW